MVSEMKSPKNWPNICFIVLIVTFLLLGFVRTVFFPKDVNYYENRYSEKILPPTLTNITNQTFQDSIEDALADQIPTAQRLKKYYNSLTSRFLNTLTIPIIKATADSNQYVSYMGLQLFGGDSIVFYTNDFQAYKPCFESKAADYNAIFAKYPQLDFYAYYIEKDTDINFETNTKVGSREYLLSLLEIPEENKGTFVINDFQTFRAYFYKTDHHWNHKGSYKAYTELLSLLDSPLAPLSHSQEQLISKNFRGSKAAMIGDTISKEEFWAYTYHFPTLKIQINGQAAKDYGTQGSTVSASVSYGSYYGPDSGEIIFDSGRDELENILIIGESYDNALLKLLASHYNMTYSIDLRNYAPHMGQEFDFDAYISEHEIDKVLLIGNVDFWTMEEFLLENH